MLPVPEEGARLSRAKGKMQKSRHPDYRAPAARSSHVLACARPVCSPFPDAVRLTCFTVAAETHRVTPVPQAPPHSAEWRPRSLRTVQANSSHSPWVVPYTTFNFV